MFATAVLEESLGYFPKSEGPLPCVLPHSRPTFNKSYIKPGSPSDNSNPDRDTGDSIFGEYHCLS